MTKYWIMIRAKFNKPNFYEDSSDKATHYYRNFGVTAYSLDDAMLQIRPIIEEDDAFIEESEEVEEDIKFKDLEEDIQSQSTDPNLRSIWYQGGRVLYDENDNNEDNHR